MALGMNLDDAQVVNLYNMTAHAAGWKKITVRTVGNKRSEWQIYTDAGSRGKINHDNVHAMQVKRRPPTAPLLYWTVDGWDVELLYQKVVQRTDKDGKVSNVTEYHHRMTVVVVLDPCNNYPIGYAIGTHETPALIRSAIRNAVQHTGELFGELHCVHQLQTDRYGKGTLTPFYEAVSQIYTPARVKNAKAKVIEPYFKRLNKKYCQLNYNWSGFGVTARKENQPNVEFLNKLRHTFPDQQGCFDQIVNMIESERRLQHDAYVKAYGNLTDDKKFTISPEEFIYRLGETSPRNQTNKLSGNGVNLTIDNKKYFYDSFDPQFRQHRNENWILRYDPNDMSQVHAANADGSLRFMLYDKFEQPMTLAERVAGDSDELQKIYKFNDALVEDILEVQQNDFDALDGLFDKFPAIQDTLGKLLIVDSKGQHKDNKSHARLIQQAQKQQLRLQNATAQQEQKDQAAERVAYLNTKADMNEFLTNNTK